MPPKIQITKEKMIDAALALVRSSGAGALNARSLAAVLGCSTQPIFSNFSNMESLKVAVAERAIALFVEFTEKEIVTQNYPPYKAAGMAYIRFAKEEKELFKLLYMEDCDEIRARLKFSWDTSVSQIRENYGYGQADAEMMHAEMWVVVHGIATMLATGYMDWDFETASEMLSDAFLGIKTRFPKE
jgi:AcrR family transcriptional regulator